MEIFLAYLHLGTTSFGGPIAHLAYMRDEFVHKRAWLDEAKFAQLLAICQFLPGPSSSQLGFAIGMHRGGWIGGLLAFLGFTLPSALVMFAFAASSTHFTPGVGATFLHGLKLVAVVVVTHGLIGMTRQLAPDAPRAFIAVTAAALILITGNASMQLIAILLGGVAGLWACRYIEAPAFEAIPVPYGKRFALALLMIFAAGLGLSLAWPSDGHPTLFNVALAFYQAGSLVFGGGHVVLPLLEQSVVDVGWVDSDTFLAGYGAAQALPGPMFTLATFIGAEIQTVGPKFLMAAIALLAMFLPGFLLLLAVLPFWASLARIPRAAHVMAGINAAVVGLLAAALYDPVWTEGIRVPTDVLIVLAGFALATRRVSAIWVVVWCVTASVAVGLF